MIKGGIHEWFVLDGKEWKNIKFKNCAWIITTDDDEKITVQKEKKYIKNKNIERFYPVGCFLN